MNNRALSRLLINGRPAGLEIEMARTFRQRLSGLMGRKEVPGRGMFFPSTNGIHTFFMRFSLDVIFLDRQNRVVRIRESVLPGRILLPVFPAKSVLELPSGTVKGCPIQEGDRLTFDQR